MKFTYLILLGFLGAPSLWSVTYQNGARAVVDKHCAGCHRGPFLDLTKFPFFSDLFPEQEALVKEMIRRAELTDLKRMPPVNFPPVPPQEIALLKSWLDGGLTP